MRRHGSLLAMLAFAAVYAVLALLVKDSYYQLMLTLVLVWATFGLSWNLLSGYTGLVSFGHAVLLRARRLCDRARADPFRTSHPTFMIPVARR